MEIGPGTRAFITGASRGIGASLALALAERGVTVGLAARSLDQLQALSASLPGEHHEYECDVCSSESVQAAIDSFAADAGGIELLVANAGITHYGPFRDEPLENALRMSEVNWHGTLRTVHYGLPYMLDRGRGQIVVISSGAALRVASARSARVTTITSPGPERAATRRMVAVNSGVTPSPSGRNCLGSARRDAGQKRVPEPPAMMTV